MTPVAVLSIYLYMPKYLYNVVKEKKAIIFNKDNYSLVYKLKISVIMLIDDSY